MFLSIRNPGIADSRAILLLGVSTTRNIGKSGTIGQFGSGAAHSIALLLKHGINPVFCLSNLKMEFYSEPISVKGQSFNQVKVKYSGKNEDGNCRSSHDDLGFAVEWGVRDWNDVGMAVREFVANAIDGTTIMGGSHRNVEMKIVDAVRAKSGFTTVFLPLTQEIQKAWQNIHTTFLHFSKPELLKESVIPKQSHDGEILVYKRGVLASREKGNSLFDYNLEDLQLDESRNANPWDTKYAVAKVLGKARPGQVAAILNAQIEGKEIWENSLPDAYIHDWSENTKTREEKGAVYKSAVQIVGGDKGVLVQENKNIIDAVERKGFKPLRVSPSWFVALTRYGVTTEKQVLEGLERDGIPESEATPVMYEALDKIWEFLTKHEMLNGRDKPKLKSFTPIMSAGTQMFGKYSDGTVYIHTDYSSMTFGLMQTMLEEVVHHVTDATDMSRDFQDYLLRLITKLHFSEVVK